MSCKGSTTKPQGGGEEAVSRLRARGKMPIRERIAHVLDRDSPFSNQPRSMASLTTSARASSWALGSLRALSA